MGLQDLGGGPGRLCGSACGWKTLDGVVWGAVKAFPSLPCHPLLAVFLRWGRGEEV
jgi:hypothetical protein